MFIEKAVHVNPPHRTLYHVNSAKYHATSLRWARLLAQRYFLASLEFPRYNSLQGLTLHMAILIGWCSLLNGILQ